MPKKEGLSDLKELEKMGVPVNHDLDKEIDSYFSSKEKSKKNTILYEEKYYDERIRLCEIKAYGFKNGELQHNMPCPVCLKNPAVYVHTHSYSYFGPCSECSSKGFKMSVPDEKKEKKGWFFG
jgi:hypothetical protein